MTIVIFKFDPKEEAENIPKLVKLAGTRVLIPHLRDIYPKTQKKELLSEVKKLHKGNKKRFIKIKSFYEELWKKVGQEYIKNIEKILESKIENKKTCYIVPSLRINIAEVLGRKNAFIVAAEIQQVPLDYIMLHELTHLYYTDVLTKLHLYPAMKSPLMEGVDHLILFKSPIKKLLTGKTKYEKLGFVKANPKFMKRLENLWKNRKSFESFLKKAIKLNENTKGVKIW